MRYWLDAVNEHSLHPPFIYQLYREVIRPAGTPLPAVENLRQQLLQRSDTLNMQEMGAGSSISRNRQRSISSIARHSLTPPRFSQLLFRLVCFSEAKTILELGTSLGLNTLYLSAAAPGATVHTIEGCLTTASLAREHFARPKAPNIRLHTGNIDQQLPLLLEKHLNSVDLAYLDANHTYEATIRYFEWLLPQLHAKSVVVVDDIHWSPGMTKAWEQLRRHPSVTLSLDLYEAGLLFFRPGMQPQHYVVEF